MHVVAIAASLAAAINVLLALGVKKVGNGGELGIDFFAIEETSIDVFLGIFRVLLFAILDVDVAHNVVSQVIDYDHVLYFPVLHHFFKYLFVEVLKSSSYHSYFVMAA